MTDLRTIFDGLAAGNAINTDDFQFVFDQILSGNLSDDQIATFLLELENTGISDAILSTGVRIMREKMKPVTAPPGTIDIVGTGGDGHSTYNISTTCCFVVAGAGVPVAKHGNRAVSSKSGASDVLRALGVKLDITPAQNEQGLAQAGVTFLFAPNHHPAMKHVGPARAMLGVPTIFNRLGPLSNPASVKHFVLGVNKDDLRRLYADTLASLGIKHALVVHGGDGMDEITTTEQTRISEVKDGVVTEYTIAPEDFGLRRASLPELKGGQADENAVALRGVLRGQASAYRDIVLLNSGAAIYIAGKADNIQDGIEQARQSIDTGAALNALEQLIAVTNA